MVSLLVEEPLLHTPEASYVHWLWTLRREIPNFVIEHQLVESYIVCLNGLETAKPEERALVRTGDFSDRRKDRRTIKSKGG